MWTDVLDRQKLVETAYQKGKELNLNNKNYLNWLDAFFLLKNTVMTLELEI